MHKGDAVGIFAFCSPAALVRCLGDELWRRTTETALTHRAPSRVSLAAAHGP